MSGLKKYTLLLFALLISAISFADEHPKIVLTKKAVLEIRKELNDLPLLKKSFETAKAFVNNEMQFGIDVPIPKDMAGGYTHNRHKRNFIAMQKAGVVYQITQDEKYAAYVRDMLLKYAELYPKLGLHPANRSYAPGKIFWQNLNDANWLVYTSQAYDCVYDFLSAKERKNIEKNLFIPFANHISVDSPQFYNRVHNHSTWGNAAVGMIGLVMNNQELIDRALYGLKSDDIKGNQKDNDGGLIKMQKNGKAGFFAQLDYLFSPDGYYTEGPYYQRYAMYPFVIFAESLQNCRPDLKIFAYRDSLLPKAVNTLLNLTDNNGLFFPINDAQKGMSYLSKELVSSVDIAYLYGGKDSGLLSIANQQGQVRIDDSGLAVAKAIKNGSMSDFKKTSANYGDGADGKQGALGVLRAGTKENAVCLAMKNTSQGMGHGHFDKLSFSLYDDLGEVLPDYGAARYVNIEPKYGGAYLPENKTWGKQSIAHNTMVVNRISHFNGKTDKGNEYHSDPYFFDASRPDIQIISAKENHAYADVKMHRTIAMICDSAYEKPLVLDVFRCAADAQKDYELAYHFKGQLISTNFEYQIPETLSSMGKAFGYQHLREEARGSSQKGIGQITWMNQDRFYSISSNVTASDSLILARIGANDPNFNLRQEPMFMVEKQEQKNAVFVSVIELHGSYNRLTELATKGRSMIQNIIVFENSEAYTGISFEDKMGNGWLLIIANQKGSNDEKHQLEVNQKSYQWIGPYYFEKLECEKK